MLGGGAAALGCGVAAPLVGYVGNFRAEPPPPYLEIDRAVCDELGPRESATQSYGRIPVLLFRDPEGDLRVFVAECTHLDCVVGYEKHETNPESDEDLILCGCHFGYFDLDGKVVSGPPPRPLRPFHWRLTDDKLVIALEKENLERAP
jgi:Rieske Fe-S protein